MKGYKLNILLKRLVVVVVPLLFVWLSGCTEDRLTHVPQPEVPADEPVSVRLTIHTSQMPEAPGTRATAETEAKINDISVVVLERGVAKYYVLGTMVTSSSNTTTFDVELRSSSVETKLMIFANTGTLVETVYQDQLHSIPESEVKEKLTMPFDVNNIPGTLPMYGEYLLPSGVNRENMSDLDGIRMLRSMARVDVGLVDVATPHTLRTVQVFRASNRIQIAPAEALDARHPVVSSPSVPASSSAINLSETTVTGNVSVGNIYLPESEMNSNNLAATCLVAGIEDGSGNLSYYRIDFPGGEEIGQILRNYRYIFRIKEINAPGKSSAQEASENPSQHIETVFEKWDENQTYEIKDTENFIGFSSRDVKLRFRKTSTGYLDFRTDLNDYNLQFTNEYGAPISNEVSKTIANDNFEIKIVEQPSDEPGVKAFQVQVSALNDNMSDANRMAYFRVVTDKWNVPVTIEQVNSQAYGDIVVKILSFGTSYGSFGGSFPDGAAGNASAMKPILLNYENFGPGGVVPVHYVGMDNVPTNVNVDDLRRILVMYDIVNLGYLSNPSVAQVQVIKEWLEASPNRVLIVSHDVDTNNQHMIEALGLDKNNWQRGNNVTSNKKFNSVTTPSEGNDYFINSGPFGAVSSFSTYPINSYWCGLNADAAAQHGLVPLLVQEAEPHRYGLAIDLERRIVYSGHSRFFCDYDDAMDDSGEINDEMSKLFANIFAWAIEEVVIQGRLK